MAVLVATQIGEAAVRDLFSLLEEAPAADAALQPAANRLLREHLDLIGAGQIDPLTSVPGPNSHVACLGSLAELAGGSIHAWGHFITRPSAHAEAFATFTPDDGVQRVYMATVWRA